MKPDDDGMWFAAKRYGYGAGLPIAWQDWVLLIGYVALVLVASQAMSDRLWFGIAVAVLTLAVLPVIALHTRGGWRWRLGGRDD